MTQLTSDGNVFRGICAKGRYFKHLMRMFTFFLRSEEKSSDIC